MHLMINQETSKEDFNKKLRVETEPVKKVTSTLQKLAVDLLEKMYSLNAVGLAANQVGLHMRLCVIDPAYIVDKRLPIVMFNPEFIECGEELFNSPEGCLSLPGLGFQVPRFRNVKVKFLGMDNKEYIIKDDNSLLSSVLQHEIDHLDGVLITDRSIETTQVQYKISS